MTIPSPGPSPGPGPTPILPTRYSFKLLADTLESLLDTNSASDQGGYTLGRTRSIKPYTNFDHISPTLNMLLFEDKVDSDNYINPEDFFDQTIIHDTYHKYLGTASTNTDYAKYKGGRDPLDGKNVDDQNDMMIGDILTFVNSSNKPIYVGVLASMTEVYVGDNYNNSKTSSNLVKLTFSELQNRVPFTKFFITRITDYLSDRHIGDPLNDTPSFTITVNSQDPSMGSISGGGTYLQDTSVTINATPSTGYEFVQWTDGSTVNPRTIIVTDNATYTAVFTTEDTFLYDVKISMPSSQEIDFLYTSDIHVGWKNGGGNRWASQVFSLDVDQITGQALVGGDVKAYQNKLIAADIPTYLLDCGDGSRGANYRNISESAAVNHAIEVMKGMNYFGITTGNGEFKWDPISTAGSYCDRLNGYGLMACNVNNSDGTPRYKGGINPDFPGCKTIKVGQKKIAVIAIGYPSPNGFDTYGNVSDGGLVEYNAVTYRWNYKSSPKGSTQYRWFDSSNNASTQQSGNVSHGAGGSVYGRVQGYVNSLKNTYGFDYVIVFCHMDKYSDENYSDDDRFYSRADFLLKNTTGIDIVIPGHLNAPVDNSYPVTGKGGGGQGIIVPEAGGEMNSFGRLRIDLKNDTISARLLKSLDDIREV